MRRLLLIGVVAASASPALLAASGDVEILLTRQLMEQRGLAVGDTVELAPESPSAPTFRARIVGSYEPTPDPIKLTARRYEGRLRLDDYLALTGESGVDRVLIGVDEGMAPEPIARRIERQLPGATAFTPASSSETLFKVIDRFHAAIAVVAVLGGTAFLLALMVMRAEERREQTGVLRLVGFTRARVLWVVLLEGLVVAVVGAIFGVVFAKASEGLANRFFQNHYDTALVFLRITPTIAARCVAVSVPLGVLAGFVASWTLLRRPIVALLKR